MECRVKFLRCYRYWVFSGKKLECGAKGGTIKYLFLLWVVLESGAGSSPLFVPANPVSVFLEVTDQNLFHGPTPIEFDVDFSKLAFLPTLEGAFLPILKGSSTFISERTPLLPQVVVPLNVPPGSHLRVWIENPIFEESKGVALATLESNSVWATLEQLQKAEVDGSVLQFPDKRAWAPGRLFEIRESSQKTELFLFPLQWSSSRNALLWFKSGRIKIDYPTQVSFSSEFEETVDATAIILTRSQLVESAERLKALHASVGVESEVVIVDTLENLPISETHLPEGYKNRNVSDPIIRPFVPSTGEGYDFVRAKRIIAYLQSRMAASRFLRYLLILGDSIAVPPSYWVNIPKSDGTPRFFATDQCYVATDQCLKPKLAVGRLPFRSANEVDDYVVKVARWLNRRNLPIESELTIFGGRGFNRPFYIGELGGLSMLHENVDWVGLVKNFRTKKSFSKDALLTFLQEPKSLLGVHLDHGTGDKIAVENDGITVEEISHIQSNAQPSFLISISCANASFDDALRWRPEFSPSRQSGDSIGASLIKSQAAVIAYLGVSGLSIGDPIFAVDRAGNIQIAGNSYSLQLIGNYLEHYRKTRQGRLGDSLVQSLQAYVSKNPMAEPRHRWAYFNWVLLGDPVLPFPERPRGIPSFQASYSIMRNTTDTAPIPTFPWLDGILNVSVRSHVENAVSLLKLNLAPVVHSIESEEVVLVRFIHGDLEFVLKGGSEPSDFEMILENREGVPLERRVRFRTTRP